MPRKDPVKAKEYWDAYRKTERCKERQRAWREKRRAWRQSDEGRDTAYDANLRRLYGITIQDYRAMFDAQGGCCAICSAHQSTLKRRLNVDHCHATGRVRGLLCPHCNHAIGKFSDSVEMLQSAINYLRRQPGGSKDPALKLVA